MAKVFVKLSIIFGLIITLLVFIAIRLVCAEADNKDPNDFSPAQAKDKPIIIWFHSGLSQSTQPLKTALSSGLITHVLLLYMHRADADWKANRLVREAIEMVKKSDVKLIWCRDMWPYYALENARPSDLFDPLYYVREIQHLRAEAKEMGADFVALDAEPYGRSPMKAYFLLHEDHIKLTDRQVQRLKRAIKGAIQTVSKLDFILPAGWVYYNDHPYEIIAELGKIRISECTYYAYPNDEVVKRIEYSYEIFGAHLNTVRWRGGKAPYFLVSDIFENSHLWSAKKGLFLYTAKNTSLAVAKELVAYARTLPQKAAAGSKEPNSTGQGYTDNPK